jgi:hypothetical protein
MAQAEKAEDGNENPDKRMYRGHMQHNRKL